MQNKNNKNNELKFLSIDKKPYCGGRFTLQSVATAHVKSVYHLFCKQDIIAAAAYLSIGKTELLNHLRATATPEIKIKTPHAKLCVPGQYSDNILSINYSPIFPCPTPKLGDPCPLAMIELIHIRAVYYDLLNQDTHQAAKLLNIDKQRLALSKINFFTQ